MKYTPELRTEMKLWAYGIVPISPVAEKVLALIDEIDRLNAYALRLLSDETRTWHCEKCGHDWLSNALVGKSHADCPECEVPMRTKAELMQERITELEAENARLTAEAEKHRWVPVSEPPKEDA